jgi:flagellar basal body rod protein FlgC
MDPSSIALQGLQQADVQLETAAAKLAGAEAASPAGANLDQVDISTEVVAVTSAQNLFAANVSALKIAEQMQKALLDITA